MSEAMTREHCQSAPESTQSVPATRESRFEFVPQRGKARFRVRYREGSAPQDGKGGCRLCK